MSEFSNLSYTIDKIVTIDIVVRRYLLDDYLIDLGRLRIEIFVTHIDEGMKMSNNLYGQVILRVNIK